jgi:HNH endonuclease
MAFPSMSVRLRVACRELFLDPEDVELFGHLACYVLKNHKHYKYFGVTINDKRQYLHRIILNVPDNLVVDHINGNTIDNRKENLRICTNVENTKNLRKQCNGHTSKYKGVSYYARDRTWEVNVAGYFYGRYVTERMAAEVYNKKALLLFGEFAKLNTLD